MKFLSRYSIVADEDGVYYKNRSKEDTLVPWGSIAKIEERILGQRLVLFDTAGKELIRIEYQLNDFAVLRGWLIEALEENINIQSPAHFSRSLIYHLSFAFPTFVCLIVSLFLLRQDLSDDYIRIFLIVSSSFFGLLLLLYLSLPLAIDIGNTEIMIKYALFKRRIFYADITSFEIRERRVNNSQASLININVSNKKKPYLIGQTGADVNVIYLTLKKTIEAYKANTDEGT